MCACVYVREREKRERKENRVTVRNRLPDRRTVSLIDGQETEVNDSTKNILRSERLGSSLD